MGDKGWADIYAVFTMILCALVLKQALVTQLFESVQV